MSRRPALLAALAATLAAGALVASSASAGNVAWGVSVGVPGLAVSVGAPAYGPAYGFGPYRPYYRPYALAPVVVGAPVFAPYPYAHPAPVVVAPRVHGPRRVVVGPYAYRGPRPVPYGLY